jgi:alkanesulfonate monooxygenase SsuD/methylene tetrahydromethanopterin reductase-like flavin-dependent oxidoreductase (luciferase family)
VGRLVKCKVKHLLVLQGLDVRGQRGRSRRYGGGGAATTWLVGSAEDVAAAMRRYADLGITHFVLSDTPYQREVARIGERLLGLLRQTQHV